MIRLSQHFPPLATLESDQVFGPIRTYPREEEFLLSDKAVLITCAHWYLVVPQDESIPYSGRNCGTNVVTDLIRGGCRLESGLQYFSRGSLRISGEEKRYDVLFREETNVYVQELVNIADSFGPTIYCYGASHPRPSVEKTIEALIPKMQDPTDTSTTRWDIPPPSITAIGTNRVIREYKRGRSEFKNVPKIRYSHSYRPPHN